MNQSIQISCRVCAGTEAVDWIRAKEMMYGTREEFDYFRCGSCGCLQIAEIPTNMAVHYPQDYYSCRKLDDLSSRFRDRVLRSQFYPRMTRCKLGASNWLGKILCKIGSGPPVQAWFNYLKGPVSLDMSILDVGCGSGEDLLGLANCGFTQLLGVDPYLERPLIYESGLEIRKAQLSDITGKFGLITFHHVFEHVEDPKKTLLEAKKLLEENGQILIRIPVSDSSACEKYREHWAQLDAPRHITLQTRESMEQLAKETGLRIIRVAYDSSEFQFWGSEQYVKDIPLSDPRSYPRNPDAGVFSKAEIQAFIADAKSLNESGKGDQAAFVLVADP